jgi:hypothetical protein
MATYTTIQPRRKDWDLDEYDTKAQSPVYSIAQIVFTDGTRSEFMVKASPSVVPHLAKEMKSTGYLTLWNDTDTICINADQLKHFTLREITKGDTK